MIHTGLIEKIFSEKIVKKSYFLLFTNINDMG